MKKVHVFALVLIVGVIGLFASLYTVVWVDNNHQIIATDTVDVFDALSDDTTYTIQDPYMGMTEEEFYREMMKGVQGDFTLEQVDSMYKSWAEEDSL